MNKKIDILTDYQHVRKRPNYYVGTVTESPVVVPKLLDNDNLIRPFGWEVNTSMALYKLLSEILDNAIDEAKRCKGMDSITISLDTKKNKITITDLGGGFNNPDEIHPISGKSNVESALTLLKAGSNFNNEDYDEESAIIGMNGVGAALVNILSEYFSVVTISKHKKYIQVWENFISKSIDIFPSNKETTGTSVSFIPDKKIFKELVYSKEVILQQLILRQTALKYGNKVISNIRLKFFVDDSEIIIPEYSEYLEKNTVKITNNYGVFFLSIKEENDLDSLMLVNGQLCEGTHNRFFQDVISAKMKVSSATFGKYVSVVGFWNIRPSMVQFLDQNKTRFCTSRKDLNVLSPDITNAFDKECSKNKKISAFVELVRQKEKEELEASLLADIRKAKRQFKKKKLLSDKYKGGTKGKKRLFIAEGDSAAGGILQHRKDYDGVYALRGKIPNCLKITDFSTNTELIELMDILDLDLDKKSNKSSYENIIISTDWDNDGVGHIAGLVINFFGRWFPEVLKDGTVKILQVPLRSATLNNSKDVIYFYSNSEWDKFEKKNGKKIKNIRYLKGLGSLSEEDWEIILDNPKLLSVDAESNYMKYLEIAFGDDVSKRKKYLSI